MRDNYDIIVIGSGFAGSLFSMIAHRQGRSVLLLERGRHPRVVIGESSTPLSNLLLEELADRYDLAGVRPLSKWGTWQACYPDMACGLKRGFSFIHHRLGDATEVGTDSLFLVAASPHNRVADTHWYRADFDQLLLHQARSLGVDYLDEAIVSGIAESTDCIELRGSCNSLSFIVRAQFVVDATGPRGCLHRLLHLGEAPASGFPATQALYNHFTNVSRLPLPLAAYPYHVEDAAVHHVFDGGWAWVLHFNNGVTSAGAAVTDACARSLQLDDGEAAWARLLGLIPSLGAQFMDARATMPFRHMPRLSFRCASIVGSRWALLPSAAAFADPMLSTGFSLTLLGIQRLASLLEYAWEADLAAALRKYAAITDREFAMAADLIAALYANMSNSEVFRATTMLYFAAASFSEAARRLNKPHLADSFLLCGDPRFGPACQALLARARAGVTPQQVKTYIRDVMRAIEPFDVAGFCTARGIPWYPVNVADLRSSAWKLGVSPDDIEHMLILSGFAPALKDSNEAVRATSEQRV